MAVVAEGGQHGFLGVDAATLLVAALDDGRTQPALQVRRETQDVVTDADHNGVVGRHRAHARSGPATSETGPVVPYIVHVR